MCECAEPGRGDLRDGLRRAALRRQDHPRPQAARARLQVRLATPRHVTSRPPARTRRSFIVHCSLCSLRCTRGVLMLLLMCVCFSRSPRHALVALESRADLPVHSTTTSREHLRPARALGTRSQHTRARQPSPSRSRSRSRSCSLSFDLLVCVLELEYQRRALAPLPLGMPTHLSRPFSCPAVFALVHWPSVGHSLGGLLCARDESFVLSCFVAARSRREWLQVVCETQLSDLIAS